MLTRHRKEFRVRVQNRARKRFWEHYDRDSYECPMCGYAANGIDREFEVHHIDGDWLHGHIFNLVAICHHCHVRVHRIRRWSDGLEQWRDRVDELGTSDSPSIETPPRAVADGGGRIVQPEGRCQTCGERRFGTADGGEWCPNCEDRGGA